MFGTIITALTSFVATNIDDIFVLMLFFSQINDTIKVRHIIIGQYLGIGALITISIIGALGISIIPNEYVGLLGLAPIYLGINEYIKYKKERKDIESTEDQENRISKNNNLEKTTENDDNSITKVIKSLINPSVFKVASVTLANGGDNIGIYIPLFTSMNSMDIFITVVIFILLIALWCYIGKSLSEYPFIQRNIEKYKHIIIPIIFIGLGIFIIIKSGTIPLIYKKIFWYSKKYKISFIKRPHYSIVNIQYFLVLNLKILCNLKGCPYWTSYMLYLFIHYFKTKLI